MNATDITSIVQAAQEDIRTLIEKDVKLAPKFLRLAFHDAVSLNCLNMSDPENLGLAYPIEELNKVVHTYEGLLSRADIWVMAALVACEVTSGGWEFPMYYYGRHGGPAIGTRESTAWKAKDDHCETIKPRDFPSADLTTHALLQYFLETFEFDARETVVVMGAHTLGSFTRNQSGFHDGSAWVDNRHVLNNEYYALLVGGSRSSSYNIKVDDAQFWETKYVTNEGMKSVLNTTIPNRFMWTRRSGASENSGNQKLPLVMTNADIAIVRDLKKELNDDGSGRVVCDFVLREEMNSIHGRCPVAKQTLNMVSEYKYNNTLWLDEFERVLRKMFTYGYTVSLGDGSLCSEDLKCIALVNPDIIPLRTEMPTTSPSTFPTPHPSMKMIPTDVPTIESVIDVSASNRITSPILTFINSITFFCYFVLH